MTSTLKSLLFPESKLSASFPWTLGTAGKKYFTALLHFSVGTFAPVLAVMFIISLPLFVPLVQMGVKENLSLTLAGCFAAGLLAAVGLKLLSIMLAGASLKNLVSGRSCVSYLLAGLAGAIVLPPALLSMAPYLPEWLDFMFKHIADKNGNPSITFQVLLSACGFFCGFGMQVRYIAREVGKSGVSFREAMGLTLKPLSGGYTGSTLVNLLLPVLFAYGITQLVGHAAVAVLGPTHQPTVELAKQATGGNFLLFALMAAVGAPIFEELVFRGFLYQVIRSSLLKGSSQQKSSGLVARAFAGMGRLLHAVFGGKRAELSAIVLSSLAFALLHMQFNPTTLFLLFALGCIQAEVFRRSGSLYCAILLHAVNNGIDVLQIALGNV